MKRSTYVVAVATVFASSLFAAGCSSDRVLADQQQQRETIADAPTYTAPMDQEQQQTPPAEDLGAASSGRGR